MRVGDPTEGVRRRSGSDPEGNPTLGQIVGGDFNFHTIPWDDLDVVLAHLTADVRDNFPTNVEGDPKGGIWESGLNSSLDLDRFFSGLLHTVSVSERE